MNRFVRPAPRAAVCLLAVVSLLAGSPALRAAPAVSLASYPLFLAPPLAPNVLVLFDNSGSMDATMSGKVISGDDPNTRSNIAREVLRNVITDNRSAFNWGLGSFELSGPPVLWNTQAYFVGSDSTMVYTNDCKSVDPAVPAGSNIPSTAPPDTTGYSVDGPQVSAPGNARYPLKYNCLLNPDRDAGGAPRNGMNFITFELSGDDAQINDVYYTSATNPFLFGIGIVGVAGKPNRYNIYKQRDASTAWTSANFNAANCLFCPIDFTPTDAGWLPVSASLQRMVFVKRGWGYGNGITGRGKLVEPVVSSLTSPAAQATAEAAHYSALVTALAAETNAASSEIKNGAFSTPLVGTLKTARDYFSGNLTGALKSPVTQSCQRNYVVLATDGNPTAKLNGTQYDPAQWINTQDTSGAWTYGQAQLDLFAQIGNLDATGKGVGGLRLTKLSGTNLSNAALAGANFDIQTYVIGLGDTIANASSVAALNEMARLGGGHPAGAFLGTSAQRVQEAFQTIVGSIKAKQGGSSSVATNTSILSSSTLLYQATFNSSDWSGDLRAFGVNKAGTVIVSPVWSSSDQLQRQDWDTGRSILTAKPSAAVGAKGIAFRWPLNPGAPTPQELDTAQSAALNTSAAGVADGQGALRLQYLRGDRSREAAKCAGCSPQFRDRSSPLGDLINSTPVLVGAPSSTFYDDIESSAYSAFASSNRLRTPMLYVGGNDGMLHGLRADTGAELLAYVPSPLVASLNQLTATGYNHRYFADGTPTIGDAFYGAGWHSLLVSGMRAGAKGVFALDVTSPATFSEANASSVVRWEFLNAQDPDMGYLFSQPVIAKTNNGRWSVIVANGYNAGSTSGHAVLFVLDAETGAVVKKIDTGAGTAASPNGLSGPAAVDTNDDGIVDVVYAGDLDGNLWKFDLSAALPSAWGVGNTGLALFNTDEASPTAGTRPITSRPNVTQFPAGGYLVAFGSGSYVSSADLSSSNQQALYGIWDNGAALGNTVLRASLVQQTVVATDTGSDGSLYRLTTHAVGNATDSLVSGDGALSLANYYASKRGWFLNLPTSGERSVGDARIRGGRAIYTTLIPNVADPCDFGGNGWLMELDVSTGNRDDRGVFDTNGSTGIDANDNLPFGSSAPSVASGYFFNGIPAAPITVATGGIETGTNVPPTKKSCTEIRYPPTSAGKIEGKVVACGNASVGRAQWREVR